VQINSQEYELRATVGTRPLMKNAK